MVSIKNRIYYNRLSQVKHWRRTARTPRNKFRVKSLLPVRRWALGAELEEENRSGAVAKLSLFTDTFQPASSPNEQKDLPKVEEPQRRHVWEAWIKFSYTDPFTVWKNLCFAAILRTEKAGKWRGWVAKQFAEETTIIDEVCWLQLSFCSFSFLPIISTSFFLCCCIEKPDKETNFPKIILHHFRSVKSKTHIFLVNMNFLFI